MKWSSPSSAPVVEASRASKVLFLTPKLEHLLVVHFLEARMLMYPLENELPPRAARGDSDQIRRAAE